MPVDYDRVMSFPPIVTRGHFNERDVMLYALGVGVGSTNPLEASELQYVYERDLKCLPTMAAVMATPGLWMRDEKYGFNWQKMLHGGQGLQLHGSLPTSGDVRSVVSIDDIYDKGVERGALLVVSRKLYDETEERLLATLTQSYLLRADGGFGGESGGGTLPGQPIPVGRAADAEVRYSTRRDQALLYRLSGDLNPLHIDPPFAIRAGFERPILHGLCTYGIAGRAAVQMLCGNRPELLRRLDVRFTRPVYPGDTLRFEFWNEAGRAHFRCTAMEREEIVLDNGYAEFVG